MNSIKTHTLKNGLRIIMMPSNSTAVYCGYVVCAGTRNEEEEDMGMAHFIEHLTFKGTKRRKSWQITSRLESVGGDLNAYTSKQETVYHATVLRPDFARAADLLTDIVFCSTYPQQQIDKEVEVICDEIDSYKDSPAELIFDEFENMIFRNHALGRDILGSKERLREYTTQDALRFTQRCYRPENMVFFVCGNIAPERTIALLDKLTSAAIQPTKKTDFIVNLTPTPLPTYTPETRRVHRDTHQAHVMMGNRTFGGRDERRYALVLLNNLLGGPGMNSRLNIALRERLGLVYSVDSYLSTYPDVGYWNVYFGCDVHDIERCCRIIKRELKKLVEKPLTPRQLAATKKQLFGQMGISSDNIESRALGLAKMYAHYNEAYDNDFVVKQLQSVTAEQLQATAEIVYREEQLSTLIYH